MKERKDGFQHIREQLDDFEYEVPSTGWKDMSAILDGKRPVPQPAVPERPRRRIAGWLWLTGLVLLFGGGLWLGAQQGQPTASWKDNGTVLSALPVPMPGADKAPHRGDTAESVASATGRPAKPSGPAKPPVPTDPAKSLFPNTQVNPNQQAASYVDPSSAETVTDKPAVIDPLPNPQAVQDTLAQTTDRIFAVLDQLPTSPIGDLDMLTATASMPEIIPANHRRWDFGLKAGADYQALQTNALVGGFAQFRLSPKWVLEAGLQYKRQSNNNGRGLDISPPQGDTIYFPAFASVSPFHRPITRVHFFEAPLTLQYQMAKRLRVSGGMQMAYLRSTDRPTANMASDNSVRMENNFADLSANQAAASNTEGTRFERWDFGLIAGLDYRIANHWSVELRWQQGLRDLTPERYYQNDEIYRNSSLQLALKWYW
jgi:hypothetical protein